jgi:hypothetical protein
MNNKQQKLIQKKFDSVNLDIEQYNIQDLEKLFGLLATTGKKYKRADIEQNEYAIRQKIMNDPNLDNNTMKKIISFYDKAKTKLINTTISHPLPTTTFQYGGREQLDNTSNIWTQQDGSSYSGGTEYGRSGSMLDIFDEKTGRRDQNEVVRHLDKDFVNTNVSNIYAGVINPLNTRFINKYLTIDSKFRDTPYTTSSSLINSSSDFTIQLPDKIQRVISMQLASLEIPITYYANSSYIGNNYVFIVITDISNNITTGLITIPDGTYTPITIATAITSALVALGGYFATMTASYNTVNGRFTISTVSASVASFKMDFTTSYLGNTIDYIDCNTDNINKCVPTPINENIKYSAKTPVNVDLTRRLCYSLGFLSGVYSGAKSYVSESVANTSGSRYIFLAVDDFNMNIVNNQFMTISKQNISSKNILARITVGNGGFLSILSENDFKIITEPRKYFGPVDITRLRVQLYDDYGMLLNMNGSDFSFNLSLEVVYDL